MPETYSQAEFDSIAKLVAIADELAHEPFVSEDSHDTVYNGDSKDSNRPPVGFFTHPALLKSAAITFRKLWLKDDYCFPSVCALISQKSANEGRRSSARVAVDEFQRELTRKAWAEWSDLTTDDVFQIWINTQIAHAGPKWAKKTPGQRFDLDDFDRYSSQLGRARFEFMFRISLKIVGSNVVLRHREIILPEYWSLRREGRTPSFEVELALRNSLYASPESGINIDDYFWNLNNEATEETFLRLMERQAFDSIRNFLRGYFGDSVQALAAVNHYESLDSLLVGTKSTILTSTDPKPPTLTSQFHSMGDFNYNGGRVTVYSGRAVLFEERSREFLNAMYDVLKKTLLEERSHQKSKRKWDSW